MSGRTYISQLKKQLDDERMARVKLEGELEDLKKISSEINPHTLTPGRVSKKGRMNRIMVLGLK